MERAVDSDSDSDSWAYGDAYSDKYSNTNTDRYTDSYSDSRADSNPDAYANAWSDGSLCCKRYSTGAAVCAGRNGDFIHGRQSVLAGVCLRIE